MIWGFIISAIFFYGLGRYHSARAFKEEVKSFFK